MSNKRILRKKLTEPKDWEIDFLKHGRESKFFRHPISFHQHAFQSLKSKQQNLWDRIKLSGINLDDFKYARENLE
jgi:hypothetical protein